MVVRETALQPQRTVEDTGANGCTLVQYPAP
jgi:hypothetical protein